MSLLLSNEQLKLLVRCGDCLRQGGQQRSDDWAERCAGAKFAKCQFSRPLALKAAPALCKHAKPH